MASASSTQNDTNTAYLDHFTCNICLEVLQDPVQCVKNEHYFCKKCITKHLTRSQTCPVCQDKLTPETLHRIPRTVANLLQQFRSRRCRYASRGCMTAVSHEALLSHHEECDFAPVQCSHDGCEETVNRQDLESHQQNCEFRSITCEDCHEAMRQREYGKHACVFRREIDENKRGLVEIQKILREIQDEQLRQSAEFQRLASGESGQPHAAQRQESDNLRQPTSELRQPNPTKGQGRSLSEAPSNSSDLFTTISVISSPTQSQTTVDRQIVVAGGCGKSYEVFNWASRKWTLYKDSLFFDHYNAFSFVYDNKIMLCGGTSTNRVECLDVANNSSVSAFPARLPDTECGKGVLCGDKILTFGQSASATSLKPPFKTTVLASYAKEKNLSCYGVARVNENAVVFVGGYPTKDGKQTCDNVLLYNPTTKCFENLAPLPYSVANMAVVVYKDNLVILGGKKSYYGRNYLSCDVTLKSEYLNDALMYNITNQQCRMLPRMLEKRSGCAAVIMGDTIVVMGGCSKAENSRFVDLKTAEYLVLGEDTWKKLPPMHCERVGATACLLP